MYFPVQIKALMEMWVQHKVLNCAGTVRIVNPLIVAERSFTCMKRKLVALSLALVIVLGCSAAAFAKSSYKSGTYNGFGYGTTDTCETVRYYSETGSTSDYLLRAEVTYYYRTFTGSMGIKGGTSYSGSHTKSASVGGSDSAYVYLYIIGTHYVNGSKVAEEKVYS